jgi:hypothetical protein
MGCLHHLITRLDSELAVVLGYLLRRIMVNHGIRLRRVDIHLRLHLLQVIMCETCPQPLLHSSNKTKGRHMIAHPRTRILQVNSICLIGMHERNNYPTQKKCAPNVNYLHYHHQHAVWPASLLLLLLLFILVLLSLFFVRLLSLEWFPLSKLCRLLIKLELCHSPALFLGVF